MNFVPLLSKENNPKNNHVIALFGGGGKTSMLFKLGLELANTYTKVLMTSIVKAGPSQDFPIVLSQSDCHIEKLFQDQRPLYLLKEMIRKDKYYGFESAELERWLPNIDACVFEADGARDLPLKAHNNYDPVIPSFVSKVIIMIGADVVNTQLSDGKVHRADLFKSIWRIQDNTRIDVRLITEVVTTNKGYLSKIPDAIPITFFINKADAFPSQAKILAENIAKQNVGKVYYGSIKEKWWKYLD